MSNDRHATTPETYKPKSGIDYEKVYRTLIDAYLKVSVKPQIQPDMSDEAVKGGVQ